MIRFYIEVARASFRRQLVYRWANIAGLLTNIFFGCIYSYVIIALYRVRPTVAGYDVQAMLRYTWLVQAMIMVVTTFTWRDLMDTIRTGEVVTDLSKPCNLYWYWFSREMGRNVYYLLFRALPLYLAGMLLFHIGLPDTWHIWLLYGMVLICAATLGIAYRYLYNVLAFWLLEARALSGFALSVAFFFTGSYVPIPLFPAWLRTVAEWSPFQGMMNLPAQIFLGRVHGLALAVEGVRQLVWTLLLTLLVLWLTRLADRHVIAQGG